MLKLPKAHSKFINLLALTLILLNLALPVSADNNIVYVGDRTLNLRSGPGPSFGIWRLEFGISPSVV